MHDDQPTTPDILVSLNQRELSLPQTCIFRSERNFLHYPFFRLSDKKADKIELWEQVERNGECVEILWKITRNVDRDLPSPLGRKIHKMVVERIINAMPRPIPSFIRLGSLREICRIIGISERHTSEIKKALEDIVLAGVQSKGTFYSKIKKAYIEETFHFYDGVIFAGQSLPDGTTADAVYVVLGRWLLENINAGYTVPLDWDYFRSLKGEIASRMYELLSLDFFVALEQGRKHVDKLYSQWCPYFPLTPQDKFWKVKKQLSQAFKQHVESRFFDESPLFSPIFGKQSDWTICFFIGAKAISDYRQAKRHIFTQTKKSRKIQAVSPQIEASETEHEISHSPTQNQPKQEGGHEITPNQAEFSAWLESQGVRGVKKLLKNSPHKDNPEILEFIKQDYLIKCEQAAQGKFEFKKGRRQWLSWAISHKDYVPPEKVERQIEQRKIKEANQKAELKRQEQERVATEYQQYIQSEIEGYKASHPEKWNRIWEEELKALLANNQYLQREAHEDPKAVERPAIRCSVEARCNDRVKKELSLPSLEQWKKRKEMESKVIL